LGKLAEQVRFELAVWIPKASRVAVAPVDATLSGDAAHKEKYTRSGDNQRGSKSVNRELAFEAKIDLTYIGGIERGRRNPSLMVMARIASALSVPLAKFLTD
jgi:transcriptional regulator with XRE-family HTH domain